MGKDKWLERFYRALAGCPEVKPATKAAGLRQSLHWCAAASLAARRDLTPVFCGEWRLPLSAEARRKAAAVDWKKEDLRIGDVLAAIPADFEP